MFLNDYPLEQGSTIVSEPLGLPEGAEFLDLEEITPGRERYSVQREWEQFMAEQREAMTRIEKQYKTILKRVGDVADRVEDVAEAVKK